MDTVSNKPFLHANIKSLPNDFAGGTVAIGNFDGFHLGHQALVDAARQNGVRYGDPAYVLTFSPHPRRFFKPQCEAFHIITPQAKAELCEMTGMDGLLTASFDEAFSELSPREFVQNILVDILNVRHVVTGFDFHFGKNRAGTPEMLVSLGRDYGLSVEIISAHGDEYGKFSSSAIRLDLKAGNMQAAEHKLGYPWFFDGQVIHGDKRGRELGYPTANVELGDLTPIKEGVYAVIGLRENGERLNGVANYGRRPQFDNGAPRFESYFFDFSGSLYDETLRIFPIAFLRAEMKFDSVNALIEQMDQDSANARTALKAYTALTDLAKRLLKE